MVARCLAIAVLCFASPSPTAASDSINYEAVLDDLWTASDADADGELSKAEFTDALGLLGLEASIFTAHDQSYDVLFNALLPEVASGEAAPTGLTPMDFVNAATSYPEYQDPLIAAFTNGATEIPTDIVSPSPSMASSRATVSHMIKVAGPPSSIFKGVRDQIKVWFASVADVDEGAVVLTFAPVTAARRALEDEKSSDKRELQAATETQIDATIFVADAAAADAAAAALPATAEDLATVSAFSTLTVTEVTPATAYSVPPLPFATLGIIAALLIIGFVMLICNACYWSGKKAKSPDTAPAGKGGCCTLNALKAWAFGELTGVVAILATCFYFYTNVLGVADAATGLVDFFMALTPLTEKAPELAGFADMLPQSLSELSASDDLAAVRAQFGYLPLAFVLPGVLAALFLFLGAACPVLPMHKGSLCWSKVCMFLALLLLILALVFYLLFAGVAVLFAFAPPELQNALATVRGICISIPATVGQMVTDGTATVEKLSSAGQDTSAIDAQMVLAADISDVVTLGCGSLVSLIDELVAIFVPAILCVVAIVFAAIVNETLCCAAGCCCKGPSKAPKIVAKKAADPDAKAADPDANLQSV